MAGNEKKIWNSVLELLKDRLNKSEYSISILNIHPYKLESNRFILEAENSYIKDRVERYKNIINKALNEVTGNEYEVYIYVKKDYEREEKGDLTEIKERREEKKLVSGLNPKYLFGNFIVGKSNEFAHAAAEGVAVSPGRVYNPLFIYGGVGLGKTHLMHAIGNYILEKNPASKIYYCSSEQFTNDLINSLKIDRMASFREKYRSLDLLLIDDIQFIAGKESTQEEFFYTFNTLHQYSKQIVISSDRPPQEINNIEERLISRFAWGLIADIKPPNYETRVAILKNKAEIEKIDIPYEAINYIAESVSSNIRELEGALNRVVAKASLMKKKIDFELIEEVFKGFIDTRSKLVTKDKILKAVSAFYSLPLEEIKSTKRKKEIAKARQISMYFLRSILNLPFVSIGELFGGKDHTTVMHSVNKVESQIKTSEELNKEISELKQRILK